MKKVFLCSLMSVFLLASCGTGSNKTNDEANASNDATTATAPKEERSEPKVVAPKAEGQIRVLMVGNSHTEYFASFPQMLQALCKENGKDVDVVSLLAMGVSLDANMADNKKKAEKMFAEKDADGNYFDYIILQEATPVAYQEADKYEQNCKTVRDLVAVNSPDVATYIYGLTFPADVTSSDFKDDQKILMKNTYKVAKSMPNTGVLPFSKVLRAAYEGKDGYVAIKDGKDALRHTDNSRHMLNDAVFVNSIVLYQTLFGETPKIPAQLPLATGTGDNDKIKLMDVSEGVTNPDALLKIATSFK